MNTETEDQADFEHPDSAYEDAPRNRMSGTGSSELAMLKTKARNLGLTFSNNIGIESLRSKIEAAEAAQRPEEADVRKRVRRRQEEEEARMREELRLEALKLVRCRITNMDPRKRDIPGEVITVANEYLGTVRKLVPFGEATDNGYHIPQIIYDELMSRKFQQVTVKKNSRGEEVGISTRMVPEFNIQVLPMLTEQELKELARQQEAAARLGGNAD